MIKLQYLFTLLILGGSLTSIIKAKDFFPFSNYPMYSRKFDPGQNHKYRTVRAVKTDDTEEIIQVNKYMWPFWQASFREALFVNPNPEIVSRKLRAALKFYNKRAAASGSESLKAMRVYEYTLDWQELVETQKNKKHFNQIPIKSKTLILEVLP